MAQPHTRIEPTIAMRHADALSRSAEFTRACAPWSDLGDNGSMWRSFDVDAVIDALMIDAVVVAGADGMSRGVHRARTVDTGDELRRVGAYDLVVVSRHYDGPWTTLDMV